MALAQKRFSATQAFIGATGLNIVMYIGARSQQSARSPVSQGLSRPTPAVATRFRSRSGGPKSSGSNHGGRTLTNKSDPAEHRLAPCRHYVEIEQHVHVLLHSQSLLAHPPKSKHGSRLEPSNLPPELISGQHTAEDLNQPGNQLQSVAVARYAKRIRVRRIP